MDMARDLRIDVHLGRLGVQVSTGHGAATSPFTSCKDSSQSSACCMCSGYRAESGLPGRNGQSLPLQSMPPTPSNSALLFLRVTLSFLWCGTTYLEKVESESVFRSISSRDVDNGI